MSLIKIVVGKRINGISLNSFEYMLNDKNQLLTFSNLKDAQNFIKKEYGESYINTLDYFECECNGIQYKIKDRIL